MMLVAYLATSISPPSSGCGPPINAMNIHPVISANSAKNSSSILGMYLMALLVKCKSNVRGKQEEAYSE